MILRFMRFNDGGYTQVSCSSFSLYACSPARTTVTVHTDSGPGVDFKITSMPSPTDCYDRCFIMNNDGQTIDRIGPLKAVH